MKFWVDWHEWGDALVQMWEGGKGTIFPTVLFARLGDDMAIAFYDGGGGINIGAVAAVPFSKTAEIATATRELVRKARLGEFGRVEVTIAQT